MIHIHNQTYSKKHHEMRSIHNHQNSVTHPSTDILLRKNHICETFIILMIYMSHKLIDSISSLLLLLVLIPFGSLKKNFFGKIKIEIRYGFILSTFNKKI